MTTTCLSARVLCCSTHWLPSTRTRDSVVVIGAQAIYLHTGSAPVAVAEATKDSDLGIDLRTLGDDPLIEEAMRVASTRCRDACGCAWSRWLSDQVNLDREIQVGPGPIRREHFCWVAANRQREAAAVA